MSPVYRDVATCLGCLIFSCVEGYCVDKSSRIADAFLRDSAGREVVNDIELVNELGGKTNNLVAMTGA